MRLHLPFATPFGGVPLLEVSVDKLSAFFLVTISVLVLAVSIYSIGYVRDYRGRYSIALFGVLFNVFFLSMALVVTAANALFFLIMWETMSISSYFLVVYESREESTIRAGLFHLVMTHIGTAFIMVAMLFLSSQAGSIEFSAMSGGGHSCPLWPRAPHSCCYSSASALRRAWCPCTSGYRTLTLRRLPTYPR